METVTFEYISKKASEALSCALEKGLTLANQSADTHFIVEHIIEDGKKWKVILRVLYEAGSANRDGITHIFIRKRDEYAYRPLVKTHKFDYIHVIDDGAFWNSILERHLDLELYDAVHADGDKEGDGTGAGGFIRPTLIKKPKQAFTGRVDKGPSIER